MCPKRSLSLCARLAFAGCAIGFAALGAAPGASAALWRPSGDVEERFLADPRADAGWHAEGSWRWEPAATALVSGGAGAGSLLRRDGTHFTGTLTFRVKLNPGDAGRAAARLIFAYDASSGACRWLEVSTGAPGRLVLGQTGEIRGSAGGTIQVYRAAVPAGRWLEVGLRVAGSKAVSVTLDGRTLFTAACAPIAPGRVGFGALAGQVVVDRFSFAADPDGEPCRECHAGQPEEPLAANVYTWWDGTRWDQLKGTSRWTQQGGHGDPGGSPALTCTGSAGCHDLRLPAPGTHRNGILEGRTRGSRNAYHLRAGFLPSRPASAWDTQVTFDNFCYDACHSDAGVYDMRHDGIEGLPVPNAVQLGLHISYPDGASNPLPVDGDLSTSGTVGKPDFVPCVSCHDPHGTGRSAKTASNKMVRANYGCSACHP